MSVVDQIRNMTEGQITLEEGAEGIYKATISSPTKKDSYWSLKFYVNNSLDYELRSTSKGTIVAFIETQLRYYFEEA